MAMTFFFYDLETTGFNPREARIMQFAGQRTDENLNPVGDPVDLHIKITPDIVPEPEAILLTGITPQKTLSDGLSEADFLKVFYEGVVKPDTIFVGFNSIRFDDEFMRFLHYRNFYDAYGWQWKDGCSRWDILDLVRMTRALRPDGIEWPFTSDGKPVNRLELLTKANKLDHFAAHDALSDVSATIAVAKLIKEKQPELFGYLLKMRSKREVASLVDGGQAFVYTSGHFPSDSMHTSAVIKLAPNPSPDAALVYDLRHDPEKYLSMSVDELIEAWAYNPDKTAPRLPVKTIKYNRVPAVAPLGVIKDKQTQERIGLSLEHIESNLAKLKANQKAFAQKILDATEKLNESQDKNQASLASDPYAVDGALYDGFFEKGDTALMADVRSAKPDQITLITHKFSDERLKNLAPLYKARNYPKYLEEEERKIWDDYCKHKLTEGDQSSRLAKYFSKLAELAQSNENKQKQYLLEELQLYGQSLLP